MTDTQPVANGSTQPSSSSVEGKYLTFHLGKEQYGLSVLKVKEIVGIMPITEIPQAPTYVDGVINLRGKVIPIINLRRKFAMQTLENTERTCIIVVEIENPTGHQLMGIVVDEVSEVRYIKNTDIEEPPHFSGKQQGEYILGMAKAENELSILLDIDRILRESDIINLEQNAA